MKRGIFLIFAAVLSVAYLLIEDKLTHEPDDRITEINNDSNYVETTTTKPVNPTPAQTTSVPTEDQVYNYMQSQFDAITNYGANYIPERDDPIVLKKAADKFGISEAEADRIYLNKVMGY